MKIRPQNVVTLVVLSLVELVLSGTDPGDFAVLKEFRDGLSNPELLNWPGNGDDPCGPPRWDHVFCSGTRVTMIVVQNLGLNGTLPQDLNKLSMLKNIGFQGNKFSGKLPSFSGLSNLQYAYLDFNNFDTIPADFFDGLHSLQVLALDQNNLNASTGWSFPKSLQDSSQLTNLSCVSCNLIGPLPDFLGSMPLLTNLRLSYNKISGVIPASFSGMALQSLWLNDQQGGGLTGPIDVVVTMESLSVLWLHGNQFSGLIPEGIGNLTVLTDLNLNSNQLVGLIPDSLAKMDLYKLDLNNNQFMGPIPEFRTKNVTFASNAFCQSTQGLPCSPEVMALIEFLQSVNYPPRLVQAWSGNNPCSWVGIHCTSNQGVDTINLPHYNLSGTLSPSVASLVSLSQIKLQSNNLSGLIPGNWTSLKALKTLDLSNNNISGPIPKFTNSLNLVLTGNPLLESNHSGVPPATNNHSGVPPAGNNPPSQRPNSPSHSPRPTNAGSTSRPGSPAVNSANTQHAKRNALIIVAASVAGVAVLAALVFSILICCYRKEKGSNLAPSSLVIHPRDPSNADNAVKIVVASNTNGSISTRTGSGSASRNSGESHVIEAGNLVISVQVLRNVTKNFAPENELGRGGFGVVYKGELQDGTNIAVKRMEAGVISNKALDEFQAEIAVLSKVRHRHLVSLLGYSIEGNERVLVYEYMPQGALSKHLF